MKREITQQENIRESIIALKEAGKIPKANIDEARKYCKTVKIGTHECCVKTRLNFSCDLCLENELLSLQSKGVHTANSCCGHGNPALASILVVGEESEKKMRELGYEFLGDVGYRHTNWRPKALFIYDVKDAEGFG